MSMALPIAASRRGACPSLDAPMQTGDGLLARIRVSDGRLDPSQLAGIASAAAKHGNGLVEVTARGTLEAATMTARGDLDRLAAELRRFSDLGDLRLAGTMTAGLETKRGENDALSVTGNATVDRFELTAPGKRPWREERLTIDLAGFLGLDPTAAPARAGGRPVRRRPSPSTRWPTPTTCRT